MDATAMLTMEEQDAIHTLEPEHAMIRLPPATMEACALSVIVSALVPMMATIVTTIQGLDARHPLMDATTEELAPTISAHAPPSDILAPTAIPKHHASMIALALTPMDAMLRRLDATARLTMEEQDAILSLEPDHAMLSILARMEAHAPSASVSARAVSMETTVTTTLERDATMQLAATIMELATLLLTPARALLGRVGLVTTARLHWIVQHAMMLDMEIATLPTLVACAMKATRAAQPMCAIFRQRMQPRLPSIHRAHVLQQIRWFREHISWRVARLCSHLL